MGCRLLPLFLRTLAPVINGGGLPVCPCFAKLLDGQLEFFLVMAFFRTARFFVTLDLDLRGEGEDDGGIETLVVSLEMKGVIHFTNFPKSHSSESRSLSLSPSSSKGTGLSPSPHPLISLFTSQALLDDLVNSVGIDL